MWKYQPELLAWLLSITLAGRDGYGSKIFDPGRVSHLWVRKISPKNTKFFKIFPTGQKKFYQVESKNTPEQSWVSLLFSVVQKYTQVKSGLIPYLRHATLMFCSQLNNLWLLHNYLLLGVLSFFQTDFSQKSFSEQIFPIFIFPIFNYLLYLIPS